MKFLFTFLKLISLVLISAPILTFVLIILGVPLWAGSYLAYSNFELSYWDTSRILLFFIVFYFILTLWISKITPFLNVCIHKYYASILGDNDDHNKPA